MPQLLPHLKWVFALCAIAIVVIGLIINGLCMLVSPRAWYRLPHWFRASGGLPEEKYGRGWGAIQVRLVGATFLGGIAWVIYDVISRHR